MHVPITTLQSQIGSQLSGKQKLKTVQSDQKRKYRLVYLGIRTVFYSSFTLRKDELSIANIIWRNRWISRNNLRKTTPNINEKDDALCNKSIATMAKLTKLHFELFPHPSYSLDFP